MIARSIELYKILCTCPYPLLPSIGPSRWEIVGKAWVILAEAIEKLPYLGKQFYNKYIVFGVKLARACN
jgi:hypothetical protein